jgi:hypothetical protein
VLNAHYAKKQPPTARTNDNTFENKERGFYARRSLNASAN